MASYLDGLSKIYTLSPDKIMSRLVYFRDQAHYIHFNTTSFEIHKAMDKLYNALDDAVDDIGEVLLGYIAPERYMKPEPVKIVPGMAPSALLDDLCKFTGELYEYGEDNKWWAISNMAADLEGVGYRCKYLLTLK